MFVHEPRRCSFAYRAGYGHVIIQVAVRIARKLHVGVPVTWVAVGQLGDHVYDTRSFDWELRMPPSLDQNVAVGIDKTGSITIQGGVYYPIILHKSILLPTYDNILP